jgi:hypothetical protein
VPRRCVNCGVDYIEAQNVGRLQCRLHPCLPRYELATDSYVYDCCGYRDRPDAYGRSIDEHGCAEADHMESELCDDDQYTRYKELFDFSLAIVPCGRFCFGHLPPLQRTVLYVIQDTTSTVAYERKKSVRWEPFGTREWRHQLRVSDVMKQVGAMAVECPLLARLVFRDQQEGMQKMKMLVRVEKRWRSTLDDDEVMDEEDTAVQQREMTKLLQKSEIIIPFVIVKRVICAPARLV